MMNRLLILNKRTFPKDAGFTTLEILVSLIIALSFVAVSMQSLVYAMAMKVQAQEKQRANELIQEDIERINRLGSTALTPAAANDPQPACNPVATPADASTTPPTPAYTVYQNSYANALWNALQAQAAGNSTTTTVTKTIIKKIKSDGSVETGGKTLGLRRFHVSNTAGNSTAPHRTLKVGYQVWNWDGTSFKDKNDGAIAAGDEPIAETYVEIIPDVALQCP